MRCAILVLSLGIFYATASPIADTILPEDSLYTLDDDLDEASQKIREMTASGKSDKDCRKLVTETRNDVTKTVTSAQKTLDGMEKGDSCMKLGQAEVNSATKAKAKADGQVKTYATQVKKTAGASISLGQKSFSSLTEGNCDFFFSSSTYTNAKNAHDTAVSAHTKAVGAAIEAAKLLKKAIDLAEDAKNNCLCKTKLALKAAFKTAQGTAAANKKAWDFASKLECVLDGKTTCKIAPCPAVKMVKASAYAEKYDCAKGAVKEIARKAAEKKAASAASAPQRAAELKAEKKKADAQVAAIAVAAKQAEEKCKLGVANCQPGKAYCQVQGANCRQGYTFKNNICEKPAGTTTDRRTTNKYFAWVNCARGCPSGYSVESRKYHDIGKSTSTCTCAKSKYSPKHAYAIDVNKMVGKCSACNGGYHVGGDKKCAWTTVCRDIFASSSRHYAWTSCYATCPGGYSGFSKHCHDITCSSSTCQCKKSVCKRCANCGWN
jgi:hypothetical protein